MVSLKKQIDEITWQSIDIAVDELCEYYDPTMFDAVFGIANGGIIPATLVANKLKIKYIEIIKKDDEIEDVEDKLDLYESVLIVDDINDSGKTLEPYMHIDTTTRYSCATLYQRHSTKWPNILCGVELKHDKWLLFPWEVLDK
jgi:hypoxanthine phosphoribosyltransferase